ncbi:MAG TPA: amylo-alpha-1,6-glucosidase, partial [Rhizomicrobium sp.]|nr:amylo-alpha-1,6-glucosidase [Rhizomicrobium sp.]
SERGRQGVIHIRRSRFLWASRLHERVALRSFSEYETPLELTLCYGADFRDTFEVRGTQRPMRGRMLAPEVGEATVTLSYFGLDGVTRRTHIGFSEKPARITGAQADFSFVMRPRERFDLYIEVGDAPAKTPSRARFRSGMAHARIAMRRSRRHGASLRSTGRLFNEWLERSRADLALLTTRLPTGPFPYAGIPWFSTPFGRDAIITSLQMLWLDPFLARGVLKFLAHTQASEYSAFRDAAPGKIMHEARKGEMTALRELPFGQYYGGVDTTPLFIMLAGAYAKRTGDLAFIETIWPSLLAAVGWIDSDGDTNKDGFIDYEANIGRGLVNQGWKDSDDSVFHADGSLATGPIALVEVQGYAFAAFKAMSKLAWRKGDANLAGVWQHRAESLRRAVEAEYWMPEFDYYAIALDGSRKKCDVRASNPGHLLFCGLPEQSRAEAFIRQLLSPQLNSGWGIRTLATSEARYNPMSYHNGSVWPHDTAICGAGLARYGAHAANLRLLSELFEAAVHFDMRLPELYCGFSRQSGEAPVDYPVACLPQAWSSGALFMLLQACLGIQIDGFSQEVHIREPRLPLDIDDLVLKGITIGERSIDLEFKKLGGQVVVSPRKTSENALPVLLHV